MSDALSKYLKADKRFLEADKENQLAGFEFNDSIDACNVASMELFKDHEDRIKALERVGQNCDAIFGPRDGRPKYSQNQLDAAVKAERERIWNDFAGEETLGTIHDIIFHRWRR